MVRKFCYSIVSLLLISTMASAQVALKHKYPEETKSKVQRDTKTTQTLTLAGMDLDTKATSFGLTTTTIGKRAADGTLKIEEKVDSLQIDLALPGGMSLQFDSANPDKKSDIPQLESVLEVMRAGARLPVTVELDKVDKMTSAKLPDGEFEKLPEAAKGRFNLETLKKEAEQALSFLPDEPVKKGDTWERSTETTIGGGQTMSFRTKYEYLGTVEKDGATYDKILGKATDVTYSADGSGGFQITKSELKIVESENTYLFDRERGTVQSKVAKVRMAGPITMVVNGMEFAGKVDLTIEENATRIK